MDFAERLRLAILEFEGMTFSEFSKSSRTMEICC
jgi:hypothetical protein